MCAGSAWWTLIETADGDIGVRLGNEPRIGNPATVTPAFGLTGPAPPSASTST